MKEKFYSCGGSSCPQDDGKPIAKGAISGGKPRCQRVEDNAFHQGNFVINCQHDPRDRVAGDVSH
jgi:hypothetical protein